jgi:hypothetical protein
MDTLARRRRVQQVAQAQLTFPTSSSWSTRVTGYFLLPMPPNPP